MPRRLPFVFLIHAIVGSGRICIVLIVTDAIIITLEFVARVGVPLCQSNLVDDDSVRQYV